MLIRVGLSLAAAALLVACDRGQRRPIQWGQIISASEIASHRLFEINPIRSPHTCVGSRTWEAPELGEAINVQLHVDPAGQVLATSIGGTTPSGASLLAASCVEQVRTAMRNWRYRPFEPGHEPVELDIIERVDVYAPERWRQPRVPFPETADLSNARVVLERTGCYGGCPVYRVELRGDGVCIFDGGDFVRMPGIHRDTIDRTEFAHLVEQFRAADFFSLLQSYFTPITDNPTYRLTLEVAGRRATVSDHVGMPAGMPVSVRRLEREVDRVANTDRWIRG